jgi:methylated-DNA-[protein]-cysteine S-methyltransferase
LFSSRNPISIIVPCHRVIGSNGKLTGYAGGLDKKQWLLAWERETTTPDLPTPLIPPCGRLNLIVLMKVAIG